MQVGMKEEILSPTVEHGNEADLGKIGRAHV